MFFKNSLIIGFFLILSNLLAIFRERMFLQMVGPGEVLDVYNASFRIPDLMLGVMMSFVAGSTVIPFFTKYKTDSKEDLEGISKHFSSLFIVFVLMMMILSLFLFMFMRPIIEIFVNNFTQDQLNQTVFYSRVLLIQPLLLGLSMLIGALAQSRNLFWISSMAPIFYSVGTITVFYFYGEKLAMLAAVIGALIGAFAQLLFQSITLFKLKIWLNFSLFSWTNIKEQLSVSIPRSGSFVLSQLRLIVITFLFSSLGTGMLSLYSVAQKFMDVFTVVIANPISISTLPTLSENYNEGHMMKYKKLYLKSFGLILTLSIVIGLLGYFYSYQIINLVYGDFERIEVSAKILGMFMLTLPVNALGYYLTIAFSARKNTKLPFYASLFSGVYLFVIAILVNYNTNYINLKFILVNLVIASFIYLSTLLLYDVKYLNKNLNK